MPDYMNLAIHHGGNEETVEDIGGNGETDEEENLCMNWDELEVEDCFVNSDGDEVDRGDNSISEDSGEENDEDNGGDDLVYHQSNIREAEFVFNEPAPDLDDELRSLQGSDDEGATPTVRYNAMTRNLALGMTFRSAKEFRKALRAWSIEGGHTFTFKKNGKDLVVVKCDKDGCEFKIRESKIRDTRTELQLQESKIW